MKTDIRLEHINLSTPGLNVEQKIREKCNEQAENRESLRRLVSTFEAANQLVLIFELIDQND